jgi:endo-1,4-beta-D-glucanase Y
MVNKKLKMYKFIFLLIWFTFSGFVQAEVNIDQWKDIDKTYKDLIDEGFEVKAYDTSTIKIKEGLIILFFVTVLQKEKQIFECQEYQTLDGNMKTLDISFMCRKLIQPYQRGIGT